MNHYNSNNITYQKIENFTLQKQDKTKIFYFSKVKKYNYSEYKLSNPSSFNISKFNYIISNKISLFFDKISKNQNISPKKAFNSINIIKALDIKKSENLEHKADNNIDNQNSDIKYQIKKIKIKNNKKNNKKIINNNILIEPIIIENNAINKNITKKTENSFNCKNTFSYYDNNFKSATFYNFNFNNVDINKNFININQKFPFKRIYNDYNSSNNFNLEFLPKFPFLPHNDTFFRNNELFKYNLNSFNSNIYPNFYNSNNNMIQNKIKLDINEKSNLSLVNSSTNESIADKNKTKVVIFKNLSKRKGRKSKDLLNKNILSKHTKFSSDNMMRKIKNKIIESSRLLINKVLIDEIYSSKMKFKFPYKGFKKIKGSFSQELNIKFNLWFYQIKISDIFSLEISNKYSSMDKLSNKELIGYIYNTANINSFMKTKLLLNMPFHQYYHDIFLSENRNWTQFFNIKSEENIYTIEYFLHNLENDDNEKDDINSIYVKKIKNLAENYEDFFLDKKMRNIGISEKKNNYIKNLIANINNNNYLQNIEQVKQIKNYYNKRKNPFIQNPLINISKNKNNDNIISNDIKQEIKNDKCIFKVNNTENQNNFLEKKRKLYKTEILVNNN